jgi:hypothetical protein
LLQLSCVVVGFLQYAHDLFGAIVPVQHPRDREPQPYAIAFAGPRVTQCRLHRRKVVVAECRGAEAREPPPGISAGGMIRQRLAIRRGCFLDMPRHLRQIGDLQSRSQVSGRKFERLAQRRLGLREPNRAHLQHAEVVPGSRPVGFQRTRALQCSDCRIELPGSRELDSEGQTEGCIVRTQRQRVPDRIHGTRVIAHASTNPGHQVQCVGIVRMLLEQCLRQAVRFAKPSRCECLAGPCQLLAGLFARTLASASPWHH